MSRKKNAIVDRYHKLSIKLITNFIKRVFETSQKVHKSYRFRNITLRQEIITNRLNSIAVNRELPGRRIASLVNI